MAVSRAKKKEVLDGLTEAFSKSASVVFVNFKGLNVHDTMQLRRDLRAQGVGYTVAKKTLTRMALETLKPEGELPELPGELALAYGEDLLAPAREIYTYQQKFPEKISILGGVFDGGYRNKEGMMTIASIPPMQTLRGMFVNIINSPIQRFAIALDQVAQKRG